MDSDEPSQRPSPLPHPDGPNAANSPMNSPRGKRFTPTARPSPISVPHRRLSTVSNSGGSPTASPSASPTQHERRLGRPSNAFPSKLTEKTSSKPRYELIQAVRETIFGQLAIARDSRTDNKLVAIKVSSLDRLHKAFNDRWTPENPIEECKLLRLLGQYGE